jgi:hypothetical protein
MPCSEQASSSIQMQEPQRESLRIASAFERLNVPPGREPSHSVDAVAPLSQQSASSTLKARPAKPHHAATNVDREDNHAPGSVVSVMKRIDRNAAIRQPINLGSHKSAGVRDAIETASSSLLYLPHYSPDFNPIENAFANSRRCCEQRPREPSRLCGTRSARSSTSSPQPNVPTTSKPQDMKIGRAHV